MADEKTVMDAVNEALGEAISPSAEETEIESAVALEGEENAAPEGDDSSDSDAGDPVGEETEGEEVEAPEGRNPDGTFKKKEAPKEGEPEPEVKAKVEPPKKDPVNDPIPENLKKDTSERIRALIDTAKTVTTERDQLRTDFDYLVQGVQATGATPQQYGETLSWLAMFNSNDSTQQEKALEMLEGMADRLATHLGKDRTVGDPLSAHVDLKEAVTKGQITAQYAKEIARTRNNQQFHNEIETANSAEAQRAQVDAQELSTARAALTAFENTLQGTDPNYAAKKAVLVPAFKPLFTKGSDGKFIVPPSQWLPKFQEAYRNIQINAPAAVKPKVPLNQPLRAGKQPAGGSTRAPSSMLEAINAALGSK